MPTSYDTVRYMGNPFAQTHPNRLSTIARLYGMRTPAVDRARVLEIGCGDGGNLLPMAAELPNGQFVGVDLSSSAIEVARGIARDIGLENTQFFTKDILDIGPEFGEFDYILAHGVFAWVPEDVQQKILEIVSANMTETGVAYISYNCYPGAHLRFMVRDSMVWFLGDKKLHADAVGAAKPFLQFISQTFAGEPIQRDALRDEIQDTIGRTPSVIYHDELCDAYTPVYFHQFTGMAAAQHLKYLGDASFLELKPRRFTEPEFSAAIEHFAGRDRLRIEQCRDFLVCRRFRSSLLVHSSAATKEYPSADAIPELYASSNATVAEQGPALEMKGAHGASLKTEVPVVKAIMRRIADAWPESVSFSDVEAVAIQAGAAPGSDQVAAILKAGTEVGLIQLDTLPPRCVRSPGERPATTRLARWQAEHDRPLTTLRHTVIDAQGGLAQKLVTLLDGTRDRDALTSELLPLAGHGLTEEKFREQLEQNLQGLGRRALLVQ